MLVADTDEVRAIEFLPGQGVEDLDTKVRAAVSEMRALEQGLLCLVDVPGGSPARVIGGLAMENPQVEAVTGVNLPMLVEVLLSRSERTLSELAAQACHVGSEGMVNLGPLLRRTSSGD